MAQPPESPPPGRLRAPDQWTTGDEPMTASQAAYLRTLCRDANEAFEPNLTKAEASTHIDRLRKRTGRAAPARGSRAAGGSPTGGSGSATGTGGATGTGSPAGGGPALPRSADEVFTSHLLRRMATEVEEDLAENFDPEVRVLATDGVHHGHDGVRYLLLLLREDLPDATFAWRTRLVEGDLALLEWEARSPGGHVDEGVDTYVIRDGKIVGMTMSFAGWR